MVKDTTGAGDAFAAGLAAALAGKKDTTFPDFSNAMAQAGFWASFACTTYGGSGSCPSIGELAAFAQELGVNEEQQVKIVEKRSAGPMLEMMDRLYR
jgi:sugar/nucleoside kinase (ribokinase family)